MKPVRTNRNLRKILSIEEATYNTGPTMYSYDLRGASTTFTTAMTFTGSDAAESVTNVSFEFWVYLISETNSAGNTEQELFGRYGNTNYQYKVTILDGCVKVYCRIGGSYIGYATGVRCEQYEWTHIAITKDGTNLRLYKNGILVYTTASAALNTMVACGNFLGFILGDVVVTNLLLCEVRVWNTTRSLDQIANSYLSPRDSAVSTALKFYAKLTTLAAPVDSAGSLTCSFNLATWANYRETEHFPWRYGASFIAAYYAVEQENFSLSFPVETEITDCSICVSWMDGDIRMRQWLVNNTISYLPAIEEYQGARLLSDVRIEVWSKDGSATATLPDITLSTSIADTPSAIDDESAEELETITVDSTLAESYDISTFPATFNTQQTY